jgi:Uma2 family endonuclease
MASPDSIRSNKLTSFVDFLLCGYNSAKKLGGHVFVNRVAFRLSKHHAPEPDVGYVGPDRVHLISKTDVKGGPSAAVEVVSRESRARDYVKKKRAYQKASVTEYWIIDPIRDYVEFNRLENGVYQPVALENGHIFRSVVLPGFWLDVNWFLADSPPNAYDCLQSILASPAS